MITTPPVSGEPGQAPILNGHNVLDRSPSNATRVSVGALKNMGCVQLDESAVYKPTDQLKWALPDI